MKKYKDSDYALNKFSQGIVYKFADRIVEITLLDYLVENPSKTEQDFLKLKALSDEIYHQQDVSENRTSRLNVSINGLEETELLATASPDTELIHRSDTKRAEKAAKKLLESGLLTEVKGGGSYCISIRDCRYARLQKESLYIKEPYGTVYSGQQKN